ncbi:MAG: DUF885 family protein [Bdellovibrionales bacterium]
MNHGYRYCVSLVTAPVLVLWATSASAAPEAKKLEACKTFQATVASGSPKQKLERFFEAHWTYLMKEYPEWATHVGYPGQNARWQDHSPEAHARREQVVHCTRETLKKIPRRALRGADGTHYDLALRELDLQIENQKFDEEYLILNHLEGLHLGLPDLVNSMPTSTKADYMNILTRLETFPEIERQTEYWLREGVKRKVTPVKMFLANVPAQFDTILTENVEKSPLYKPFVDMRAPLSDTEKNELRQRAQDLIRTTVYPALKRLRAYLESEYIPNARESIAFTDMPNGKAWYAFAVKMHTTTDLTPENLHQIGLTEVERLNSEMEKIKHQVGFKGNIQEFNKHLLSDKKFFFSNKEDLLLAYRDVAKRIDAELPRLFGTLPRLPYGVREMPDYKSKSSPAAYYMSGSLEAGRSGYFEANTYDLKSRPKWGMEALTLHEAVPGHHLQIALAQELENIPEFRKHDHYTAFTEGWALYAESLGSELGLLKDPYSKYGQLSFEAWRAIRLVVDTGIHALGWSREKALQYFTTHMPITQHEAEVETDRYITWPGQALAYKIGQLKIRDLRELARTELGGTFNVREFHDEILRRGSLPMDLLEKEIKAWIARSKSARTHQARASSPSTSS